MKTYFTAECLAHVEARLRQYPVQVRELAELDRAIETRIHGGSGGIVATSSAHRGDSEPERILMAKENNARYQDLTRTVNAVKKALDTLPQRALAFIRWRYWEQLEMATISEMWHIETTALWKYRRRLLARLAPVLFPNG